MFGHLLVLAVIVSLMCRGAIRLQLLLVSVLTKCSINKVTVRCTLYYIVSEKVDFVSCV